VNNAQINKIVLKTQNLLIYYGKLNKNIFFSNEKNFSEGKVFVKNKNYQANNKTPLPQKPFLGGFAAVEGQDNKIKTYILD
jgi:hypothetical protein